MLIRWQRWNRQAKVILWVITLIGVLAALPLGAQRMAMEKTSDNVEYVFDYRDIVEVSELEARPQQFLDEQLKLLKDAGITTMAVYESSLRELMQAGRLTYYNEKDAALLQGKLPDERSNNTYILFHGEQEFEQIGPIVRDAFDRMDVAHRDWSFQDRKGIIIEQSVSNAVLKTMDFDPMTLKTIQDAGFRILPRFSDRVVPYDSVRTDAQLAKLKEYGVTRLLFDGEKAKGATNQAELNSLDSFGELLNKHGIGLTTIENLKKPQAGINKLAYLTNYNVARLYSLSPEDADKMTPAGIADRFLLAAKDRNIRMFFLNTQALGNSDVGMLTNSIEKLAVAMGGPEGVVAKVTGGGFPAGEAKPFISETASWEKPLRGVVAIGAVAIIALLIAAFIPHVAILVFVIGLIGSAGLYVLNSSLMEQGLALGAAVSAPTLGIIWVMNRIYSRTIGERRMVGGDQWNVGGATLEQDGKTQWIFPGLSIGRRIGIMLNWFVVATCITFTAVPLVFGLLNNITYSLVLEQFRGVSVLHLAPIFLVAIYVFLYEGSDGRGVIGRAVKLLKQPITLMWVMVAAVLGAVGFYYLSRTGNSGQVPWIELVIRTWLESTFGVRPRFKEFMLGHPPLILGLFLALRYRAAWVLIIVGTLGQLTMVSTFTHIHTPLYISIIRVLLGLGTGLVIGGIFIAAWIVLEGAWRKWVLPKVRKYSV
ncbi:hypothetical protein I6N90_22645 [Paenibacillus sp. GSMTC-2017]|uniref:DUF5693 family protein n=1 Tax=Paenibacillus sp. GSMTC-2017 TaxID=2794350 RepID=UPI0018D79FC8|nr:DUF5693 family protein [Paenibacillus sp. GSMTC-2017]MBH5320597.1 hypothetical protein [Paenibacillus sp. GSMTC-2017]